jgi:subfamily B ATP-binding cassette protein HlyB/CyaB
VSVKVLDTGLLSLAVVARLHGKAAEPNQLAHELGLSGVASAEDVLVAARRLELKARLAAFDLDRAAGGKLALPCILELRPVSAGESSPPAFAVLARIEGENALLHDPVQGRPQTLRLEDLRSRLTGRALFITSRAALAAELSRFDFTWFIPAIVKYRKLIGEALIASLALQVFALITPLFFQVVVDKVLVHKGLSTLTVIAVGLLASVIFESLLSALRTYVLAHTTSRIDVELGARLFRHPACLAARLFRGPARGRFGGSHA